MKTVERITEMPKKQLTIEQILRWIDVFRKKAGKWPTAKSGRVQGTKNETWVKINSALYVGHRSLPGGSSLAQLLWKKRRVQPRLFTQPLTIEKILSWADLHH